MPLIFCIFFYKKLNTKVSKAFLYYSLLLSIFSILSYSALEVLGNKEAYIAILKTYAFFEFLIISIFFSYLLKKKFIANLILLIIIPFFIFALLDYILTDKKQFNNHTNLVSAFLIIVYVIYYLFEKMKTVVMSPLYQSRPFWICVAYLVYFAGTFFFFLFISSSNDKAFKVQMSYIYTFVTITKNILLCLSLFASENIEHTDDALHIPSDINLDEFSLTSNKNS